MPPHASSVTPPVCSDAKAAGAEKVHTKYLFNTCQDHFSACSKVPRDTDGMKCYQGLVHLCGLWVQGCAGRESLGTL
jgi:hypothetical protein